MIDFKARLACDITPADLEVVRGTMAELNERGLWPLPEDYLEFLSTVGSLNSVEYLGVMSPGDYGYSDGYVPVDEIYTAKGHGHNDVLTENEMPSVKGMLDIGWANASTYIMSLQEGDFGHIYYLVDELFYDEETGGEFEYGDPKAGVSARRHLVATSFTDFLNLLRCDDVSGPLVKDPSVYGDQIAWASLDGIKPRHPAWDDE